MFCSSLRRRGEWATVPATLLSSQIPRWTEKKLETHDVAIPAPTSRQQNSQTHFLFLLLSPTDVQPIAKTIDRVERLYHQKGGLDVGIVFLLNEQSGSSKGIRTFMELQASLISTFNIPIIPLSIVSSLQATLLAFQKQLVQTRLTATPNPQTTLLPFCYAQANGMPEHTRNVLSDICHSIPELAKAATTTDGQEAIKQYLGTEVADEVITFWKEELYYDA